MEKMRMETKNLADENIKKLMELFPSVVTETVKDGKVERAVDFDALKQELSDVVVEGNDERYQFTWPDKRKARLLANTPVRATLRPCKEESVDFDSTQNLYIEGDNLDVLKLMRETYLGKIKMIYIDPPYNTGNDFIYGDDFAMSVDEYNEVSGEYDELGNRLVQNSTGNGRFHTDWLNMMYPRIKLAKDLMSDDGVIFISIDDNEQENLKKICDEVFGASGFVIQIAWRRTDNQPNIGKFARVKEYILCYAKDINKLELGRLPLTEKARNEYRYSDEKGIFRRSILLHKTRGRYTYPVTTKSGHILNGPWMKTEEEFKKMDAEGAIYWTSGGDEQPYGKIYLDESAGQIANDFWNIEYGTNQRASKELEDLFEFRCFDFSKPSSLIEKLISLGSSSDSYVMDFFSGSATTAHAVMRLNAEDGGKRKFIMVQLPENCGEDSKAYKAGYKTICEIGEERIRRAGKKIKEETGLMAQNLDTGFRVLRLDSSNMKDVYYKPDEISQQSIEDTLSNVKEDRTPMDLLFQVMLENDALLSSKIDEKVIEGKKVFVVNDNDIVCCFDSDIGDDAVKAIAQMKPLYAVFRDSSFKSDDTRVNAEQYFRTYSPNTELNII